MRKLDNRFRKLAINYKKLEEYGFVRQEEKYIYETNIQNNEFKVIIVISEKEKYAKLIEIEMDSEYVLVDVETAIGDFVGNLRKQYENIINDVIEKCTTMENFTSKQAKEIIEYIRKKYNDELEFLWDKSDDAAIWRNKQNNKWYGLLMAIPENKLIGSSEELVEVINLRYSKDESYKIIDNEKIFPGYHMNKKSWISIKLDETMTTKEIYEFIDNSYNINIGNKSGKTQNELAQKVYEYLATIPNGKVVTYKQIAEYLGNKGLARVVGNILHQNPDGDKYPCYKVLNSKGELASNFVFGGKKVQKERLEKDGIEVIDEKVDMKKYQWKN